MANLWNGYTAVNDDLRHTWERVAYGRAVTDNLTESDVPGMALQPGAKEAEPTVQPMPTGTISAADLYGTDPSQAEREQGAAAWQHAENAPGIRREMEAEQGRPYTHTDASPLEARGSASREALYGAAPEAGNRAADLYGPSVSSGSEIGSVWGRATDAGQPHVSASDLYGPGAATNDAGGGNVWGNAPADSPTTSQPSQGSDMTPG